MRVRVPPVCPQAIRSLCLKFPQKHRALMNFLSNVLREEGGYEYKKAIVNAILVLIQVRCVWFVCISGRACPGAWQRVTEGGGSTGAAGQDRMKAS